MQTINDLLLFLEYLLKSTSIFKRIFIYIFQIMIKIGSLLDACGISYTDKQLEKLDKLCDELLKKLILQQ